MFKYQLLSVFAQVILSVLLINQIPIDLAEATCTGADPCNACKNCHYCRHCAKEGGKCGVCK